MRKSRPRPRKNKEASQELARTVATLSLEKKAGDVRILDLRGLTDTTDFFVIVSVDSDVQARAVADHIVESLKQSRVRPWHVEGYRFARWILIDYVNFVVHVFHNESRKYYQLERLWGDAEVEVFDLEDSPE